MSASSTLFSGGRTTQRTTQRSGSSVPVSTSRALSSSAGSQRSAHTARSLSRKSQSSAADDATERTTRSETDGTTQAPKRGPKDRLRGFFVLRAGERMDETFPRWIEEAQDKYGEYQAIDMNQPSGLPRRSGGKLAESFRSDPPLTQMGTLAAKLTARGFDHSSVVVGAIYCSPALRCVQTASYILQNLQRKTKLKIRVEPGLCEWQGWSVDAASHLSSKELEQYPHMDGKYAPIVTKETLERARDETPQRAYYRVGNVLRTIRERETATRGVVIVVAHALAQDAAAVTRLALRPANRLDSLRVSRRDLDALAVRYPHSSALFLKKTGADWAVQPSPLPPLTFVAANNRIAHPALTLKV